MVFGIIREGKIPADSRVAFTPAQCKQMLEQYPQLSILVQSSMHRCYSDAEYTRAGITVAEDITDADIIFGIKEIPKQLLIPGKTYVFFSHTKKLQPYNRAMCQQLAAQQNTLIDYECLEYADGARLLGFGFFAGVVGAHNGIMAYGKRTGAYDLVRVHEVKTFNRLIKTYFGLHLPNIKIAVTGSGRVAHGIIEIMNLLGIQEVEPEDYLQKEFQYPVFTQLKGASLYAKKDGGLYNREHFHENGNEYYCLFPQYIPETDILMNGIYWDEKVPRLFALEELSKPNFRISTIADITDDLHGSIPCNIGDSTIEDPVYGVNKISFEKTVPYINTSVDVMAVGNLPNELPRDASNYFGEQLTRHLVSAIMSDAKNEMLENATILKNGKLTAPYAYMEEYVSRNN